LVYIFPFWYVAPRIIWQSCCTLEILNQPLHGLET
jgi:hypothetical protein